VSGTTPVDPVAEVHVRDVLNRIHDPCSCAAGMPAGLVDMGLVRHVEVTDAGDGARVHVTLRVTEPGCMMGAPFASEAAKRLGALPGVAAVEVSLDHVADWTPEDMTPEYRRRLEDHRAERRARLLPMLRG
jgi:metal-sulfur cluster biosynthetic enzyme